MGNDYEAYWGKADPAVGGFHLAAFHSLDVAAVAERRIERSEVLRARLVALLGLPHEAVPATVALWVALHDIGKIDVRFQVKARDLAVRLDARRATCRHGGPYDHGRWGYAQLRGELRASVSELLGDKVGPLLQAVTGHHGELPSNARPRSDEDAEPFEDADRAARRAFLSDATTLFITRGASRLAEGSETTFPAVALVAGLCSVADWIGSQVDYFPYVKEPVSLESYFADARQKAERALDALRLDAVPSGRGFGDLFPGRSPRDVQIATEAIRVDSEPRLVVIEAQMGAGKTEAALAIAERLLGADAASGIFFALPTMATSNGLFKRIEDVTPRMFSGDVNVLLAHSRSRKNEAMTRLIDKAVSRYGSGRAADTAADDEDATAACAKWYLTSKRALVSQVGVGTVDQAMMAVLLVRHHFVRLYGLATNVVILDEIHAYDAYMSVILERLVEWLGALRTPVILLSATLPAGRRAAFANAYSKGAFGGDSTHGSSESTAYPLVFVVDREGHATKTLAQEPADHLLRVERITTTTPVNDVLPGLVELSRRGRIAWIRNTVSEAQVAWDAARGAGAEALLFHARMRARDRARVEREVLEGFGRDGNRETGLVIATQVIEQSLDLDFDLLLSDLAPIDLLMQRAGRLHRHLDSRPRPAGFDRRLRILIPPQAEVDALHFGLSRYVYDPVTMWIAHELIRTRDTVAVPRDLRALVEATYDPAERANRIELAPNAEVLLEAEGRREEAR
ncbi:MAG: CRISPR-associated helicase Cas3', partial [Polyangiaceae bacterium]